jgi:hypothetical protein
MDASLPKGKVIEVHRDETVVYQERTPRVFRGGSPDGYGIKVPKRDKPMFSQTPQEIRHES